MGIGGGCETPNIESVGTRQNGLRVVNCGTADVMYGLNQFEIKSVIEIEHTACWLTQA